ncbi:MFS phospholipid transporter (Git1), putative [Talaromyces stipitatus ATCC 10500]|uniref:MFS phospholipid transporter (Git1), putative n=1 Tax=Talaromyces stipitatus (strain ATCC 10500 / CBS 375.48 / QM 6759 / NRRL 1006) TaxID=441959 RepID=B8LY61_TALSN|nr:MFS phospholipid transporter (Git1), putative [Talaromyces stipitatus ATCC 10500]EED23306.1 MFS phospholipid transporter (Git1), putative [Talaromyces stipitatus ATCC 10500]
MSDSVEKAVMAQQPVDEKNPVNPHDAEVPLDALPKSRWERSWPVIACGAGLFSDGYLNGIIGSVNTMLGKIYPDTYNNSPASRNVSSIAFVGTVVGQLAFGITSDYWSRKWSLFIATIILIVFSALSAGAYGAGGSQEGLFAALTAYRFFLGIGIGGEYPAGSVAASESTGELKSGHRNRWFVFFTDFMIDSGYVVAAIVATVVVVITTESHLRVAWRICLGLGIVPPLSLLWLRYKLNEPEEFNRERMHKYPYGLIIKFYWKRLLVVSLIWFTYDFSSFSFSIYSTKWLDIIIGDSAPLWQSFAWSILTNTFYLPGSIAGAYLADWVGPKQTLAWGVFAQGVVGFIMTAAYKQLGTPEYVAAFVVVFGIFSALGELGPGDNIGLIASKSSATAIRGQYYGVAAAMGKIGAFVGTYVLPIAQNHAPNKVRAGQDPFIISSSLCIFSAVICWLFVPHIGQDTISEEDQRFREYLEAHGYDTSTMGSKPSQ